MTGPLLRPVVGPRTGPPTPPAEPVPVFRALAEPLRWKMFGHLCRRAQMSRGELGRVLGVTETMLSYHARALVRAGLIEVDGQPRSLTYAVRPAVLAELERWLDDPASSARAGREQGCARR